MVGCEPVAIVRMSDCSMINNCVFLALFAMNYSYFFIQPQRAEIIYTLVRIGKQDKCRQQ